MVATTRKSRVLSCIIALMMVMTTFCVIGADKAYAKPKAPKKVAASFILYPGYVDYPWMRGGCKPLKRKNQPEKYTMQFKGYAKHPDGYWYEFNFKEKGYWGPEHRCIAFGGWMYDLPATGIKNFKVRAKYKGGKWSKWKKKKKSIDWYYLYPVDWPPE